MLTSKAKIAEQIKLRLRKYSIDNEIDEREIMLSIHQTISSLIRARLFQSKGVESQEVDGGLYYTIKDIELITLDKEYYIKIPSTTVSLPFGVEIKRIGTAKGIGYVPVPNGFNDLYEGLDSYSLEGGIGYYKEGVYIKFVNMTNMNAPKKVNMTMILPLDSLDEDDDINIPTDMLDEIIEVIFVKYTKTLSLPSDEKNNSIDD